MFFFTGPGECGKSFSLTDLIWIFINEFQKIKIYSPFSHQELHQKVNNCIRNFVPINIIQNIWIKKGLDSLIDEMVSHVDFIMSQTEIETYKSIEEIKHPEE